MNKMTLDMPFGGKGQKASRLRASNTHRGSKAEFKVDVLALGCTAVDDLIYVATFPTADGKTPVLRRERQCGGLAATALVAAARYGVRCAYAGILGYDDASQFVLDTLSREGVDVSTVGRHRHATPIQSIIIVGKQGGMRSVLFSTDGVSGAGENSPSKREILSARVLLVDTFGVSGMLRAARIAREGGLPVVADFEESNIEAAKTLLPWVDHLIVPAEFACRLAKTASPSDACRQLLPVGRSEFPRSVVIVTCGEKGCYSYTGQNSSPEAWPAYKVPVVDTTGCGDVFHGAYAAALAKGFSLPERIQIASAAAAMKATRPGGQAGIPKRAALHKFLKTRRWT